MGLLRHEYPAHDGPYEVRGSQTYNRWGEPVCNGCAVTLNEQAEWNLRAFSVLEPQQEAIILELLSCPPGRTDGSLERFVMETFGVDESQCHRWVYDLLECGFIQYRMLPGGTIHTKQRLQLTGIGRIKADNLEWRRLAPFETKTQGEAAA